MPYESMNLPQFQRRFSDEEACLEHLFRLRWPDGFICPRCGKERHTFIKSRRLYQCRSCKYQASLTAGTVFHKTRTPIHKWFWMIFMMTRQKSGVSILRMQELLGIGSYKTAWLMGHKIRKGLQDKDSVDSGAQTPQLDAVLLMQYILNRRGPAPQNEAEPTVENGSADGKDGDAEGCDMMSESSNCRWTDVVPSEAKSPLRLTGVFHALVANIKGNIRGVHHGVSKKHLQRYLSEFCYRFNRREWDSELFDRATKSCLQASTITWNEVTL